MNTDIIIATALAFGCIGLVAGFILGVEVALPDPPEWQNAEDPPLGIGA